MDYRKLELKLRKIVEKRIGEGACVTPVGMHAYVDESHCCIIGAVIFDLHDAGFFSGRGTAEKRLRVSSRTLCSIAGGFEDGKLDDWHDEKAYAIGANIRRIYCDDNGQVE